MYVYCIIFCHFQLNLLALKILMNSSTRFDAIIVVPRTSSVNGSKVGISKFQSLKIVFFFIIILVNNANSGGMPRSAAFRPGLHYMYAPYRGFHNQKKLMLLDPSFSRDGMGTGRVRWGQGSYHPISIPFTFLKPCAF